MLVESIFLIIFAISLGGILFILVRKISAVNSLPQNGSSGIREHHVVLNIEGRIKGFFVFFEKQIFLHKLLSWTKVMTLKIETGIDHLLHNIRRKAQEADKKIKEKK